MFWSDLGKGVSVREDNSKGAADPQVKLLFQDKEQRTSELNLDAGQVRALTNWLKSWINEDNRRRIEKNDWGNRE